MNEAPANREQEILNRQRPHWETIFSRHPNMFGKDPSEPARRAAELFKSEAKLKILELGCGQGRDTLFFAKSGFQVHALDYSDTAVEATTQGAQALGLPASITAMRHDVRNPLPFADESFDACYSHMLFCMALTTSELVFLSSQVGRVLRPGGFNIYTARHTKDPDYGKGILRGENLYEVGGFVVHFFNKEMVELLAAGFEIMAIDEFEEGALPRKLYSVTLRKPAPSPALVPLANSPE